MTENVIYRQQQPAPTREGWFYGKRSSQHIRPVHVSEIATGFVAIVGANVFGLDELLWFGPIAECREGEPESVIGIPITEQNHPIDDGKELSPNAKAAAALQAEMASKELGPSNSSRPPKNSSAEPVSADNHAGRRPPPVHVREEPAATVKESLTVGHEPTDVEYAEAILRRIAYFALSNWVGIPDSLLVEARAALETMIAKK